MQLCHIRIRHRHRLNLKALGLIISVRVIRAKGKYGSLFLPKGLSGGRSKLIHIPLELCLQVYSCIFIQIYRLYKEFISPVHARINIFVGYFLCGLVGRIYVRNLYGQGRGINTGVESLRVVVLLLIAKGAFPDYLVPFFQGQRLLSVFSIRPEPGYELITFGNTALRISCLAVQGSQLIGPLLLIILHLEVFKNLDSLFYA